MVLRISILSRPQFAHGRGSAMPPAIEALNLEESLRVQAQPLTRSFGTQAARHGVHRTYAEIFLEKSSLRAAAPSQSESEKSESDTVIKLDTGAKINVPVYPDWVWKEQWLHVRLDSEQMIPGLRVSAQLAAISE